MNAFRKRLQGKVSFHLSILDREVLKPGFNNDIIMFRSHEPKERDAWYCCHFVFIGIIFVWVAISMFFS